MSGSLRVIALWVVLIVLFIAFYNFFNPHGSLPGWSTWFPLLVMAVVVAFSVRAGKRVQQGTRLNAEGNMLMARGRVVAALEKFEAARPLFKNQSQDVLAFNVGLCHLLLWQLEAAEREFQRARSAAQLSADVRPLIPTRLALVAALRGEVGEAHERLEEARTAGGEGDPLLVLTEGVLACRRGDWAQARMLLEGPTTHVLGGPLRGLRDALLAWSVERTTGERRYVDPVTVFGEASTDKLREAWPELVSFLVERARQVA
jgi:tetratricopeptide (TPR) repeat protein